MSSTLYNNINLNRESILSQMRELRDKSASGNNNNLNNSLNSNIDIGSSNSNSNSISNSNLTSNINSPSTSMSFLDHLKEGIESVNELQKKSDTMAMDLASGKSQNLHETMIAASQAELGFNLTVQVRNKILEAYQEIMRLPV